MATTSSSSSNGPHGDDGTEDLLLIQPHTGGDVREHRRVNEVTAAIEPVAPGHHYHAVALTLVDETYDAATPLGQTSGGRWWSARRGELDV